MDEVTGVESGGTRLLERLRDVWREVAASVGGTLRLGPEPTDGDIDVLRQRMNECLQGRGGEVSARARAARLGRSYLSLDAEGRRRFLFLLAEEFACDPVTLDAAMAAVKAAREPKARFAAERALRTALESPRQRLLTQFSTLPEGVNFLVDLRAEILTLARGDASMSALDDELRELLAAWFDIGFLELARITWRTPALVLEKIAAYEAVHAIKSWQDLKNRLDSDRRFFAFFHPRMPDEPLIFVEVALVRGLADDIAVLLDETAPVGDPTQADTAIFYSITSAQRGLAGISLGNFLIKRVVEDLSREFPNLKTFATLSPLPGFRAWLDLRIAEDKGDLLTAAEHRALLAAPSRGGHKGGLGTLLRLPWWEDEPLAAALRPPLMRLAAVYLTQTVAPGGRARDAVAHFHLTNGARVERLDWLADRSERGLAQSAGIMVNYLYRQADIETNHEAYTGQGRIVSSAAVRALAKG